MLRRVVQSKAFALVLLAVPVAASAGVEAGSEMAGVGFAVLSPASSPLSRMMEPGKGVSAQYVYFRSPRVGTGLQVDLLSFGRGKGADNFQTGTRDFQESDATSVQGIVRFNFRPETSLVPFVGAGLGLGSVSAERTSIFLGVPQVSMASSLDLTYGALAGVDFHVGEKLVIGFEGRAQRLMTDYDDFGSTGFTVAGAALRLNWLF